MIRRFRVSDAGKEKYRLLQISVIVDVSLIRKQRVTCIDTFHVNYGGDGTGKNSQGRIFKLLYEFVDFKLPRNHLRDLPNHSDFFFGTGELELIKLFFEFVGWKVEGVVVRIG